MPKLNGKSGVEFWKECGGFWIKRLYRITPSAWLWLLIPMLLGPLMVHTQVAQLNSANLGDIAAAVLHVENFHFYKCAINQGSCGVFALYWTLSLEEQFYILLPFVVFFFRKWLTLVLVGLVVIQVFIDRQEWGGSLAFIRTDAILLGVLIAIFFKTDVYRALEPKLNTSRFRYVLPMLLFFCLFATARYQIVSFHIGLSAIVCGFIVWLCSYDRGYFLKDSMLRRSLSWIGTRSYAIYLIHIPSFWFTREIWSWVEPEGTVFDSSFTLRFSLTALFLIVFLADINFRFIEEPLRKRGHMRANELMARKV
ncbi:acyltransferase [Pseudomonas helleri]|nr:acyltransferase [Pseudomonas helleri]